MARIKWGGGRTEKDKPAGVASGGRREKAGSPGGVS